MLSRETLVPIGSVFAIGISLAGAWAEFVAWQHRHSTEHELIRQRVEALERSASINRWTCEDHRRAFDQLKILNPKLTLPSIHKECQ